MERNFISQNGNSQGKYNYFQTVKHSTFHLAYNLTYAPTIRARFVCVDISSTSQLYFRIHHPVQQ